MFVVVVDDDVAVDVDDDVGVDVDDITIEDSLSRWQSTPKN